MSLDVSPDGRIIAFDLLGQLYTLPTAGGKAKQLTFGTAWNQQPRYSPDGRRLAFISDRSGVSNLWIMNADGTGPRRLSDVRPTNFTSPITSPSWSPDGRLLVVSQKIQAAGPAILDPAQAWAWVLAAYQVQTGRMRWVSDTARNRVQSALGSVFAPDGRLYAAVKPYAPSIELGLPFRIVRVELESGVLHPESPIELHRTALRPVVSPNGRYLVYATSAGSSLGLRIRDLQTDEEDWLIGGGMDKPPMYENTWADMVPGYAFAPDSRFLFAAYRGQIHRIDVRTREQSVVPFEAEVERELRPSTVHQFTLPDTAVRTRSVSHVALSPDGQRVAFSALNHIWVMKLSMRGPPHPPYRLTSDSVGEFYPSWFPDGKSIAYSIWEDGVGGGIAVARIDDTMRAGAAKHWRLVRDTALYFHTAISPDGSTLVAIRAALPAERELVHNHHHAPEHAVLVVIPLKGGQPYELADLTSEVHTGSRLPFEQLYFTDDPDRVFLGLSSWRLDGSRLADVLAVRVNEDTVATLADVTGVVSPDRREVLVTYRFALFAVEHGDSTHLASDTVELTDRAGRSGSASVARLGRALAPWFSWSATGRRSVHVQGGSLFIRDRQEDRGYRTTRLDVPLMVRPDRPHGTIVLRGGKIITMRGEEVIPKGDLVITDNRIVYVGIAGSYPAPTDARVFDASGMILLPGYVDIHDHVALSPGLHPDQCWQCLLRLAFGVTAARDNWPHPAFYNDIFGYRERERTGDLIGPRLFTTGIAHLRSDRPITTLEQAREILIPYVEYFQTETFKEYDGAASRRARQAVAAALNAEPLNGTVHVNTLKEAITTAIDGFSGVEHAPPVELFDDAARLLSQSAITYTHTYATIHEAYMVRRYGVPPSLPGERCFVPPSARTWAWPRWALDGLGAPDKEEVASYTAGASRIAAHGGKVAMGSHGNLPGIGFHYEMWLHAIGGMRSFDVLRSATIVGATAIGHGRDFGTLEPGKLADLQLLDKNPLENIYYTTSIRYVMKNGRLYQAADLTQIWPDRRPLPPIYLWPDSVAGDSARRARSTRR